MSWPKPGDVAFQAVGDLVQNAHLDWGRGVDDATIAMGFKMAADLVANGWKAEARHPDNLFVPVAYLYRHCLELLLKYLLRKQEANNEICFLKNKKKKPILDQHSLDKLWNIARQLLELRWPNGPGDELDTMEQIIQEFHKVDPSGQELRYSENTKGNRTLQNAPRIISLDNLQMVMGGAFNFLNGCLMSYDHQNSSQGETA